MFLLCVLKNSLVLIMAVGQTTFTVANGAVLQLHAGGNMAEYLSGDPDATAFRYTSVRFTSFGMAWFFENFDKGAASYLGETLTYTASRNCDIHEMTLFRYELPGIGNFQTHNDSAPQGTDVGTAVQIQVFEVLHDEICVPYQTLVSDIRSFTKLQLNLSSNTSTSGSGTYLTDCVLLTDMTITSPNNAYRREVNSSCVAESYFESHRRGQLHAQKPGPTVLHGRRCTGSRQGRRVQGRRPAHGPPRQVRIVHLDPVE